MRTLSFETMRAARCALKREIDDLERLASEHAGLGCQNVAVHFLKQRDRLERAMGELSIAMGGGQ